MDENQPETRTPEEMAKLQLGPQETHKLMREVAVATNALDGMIDRTGRIPQFLGNLLTEVETNEAMKTWQKAQEGMRRALITAAREINEAVTHAQQVHDEIMRKITEARASAAESGK